MKNMNTSNSNRSYRYRYFKIQIFVGLQGSQVSELFNRDCLSLEIFSKTNFVTQKGLIHMLENLTIQANNRILYFKEFSGQLEKPNSKDYSL